MAHVIARLSRPYDDDDDWMMYRELEFPIPARQEVAGIPRNMRFICDANKNVKRKA